MYASSFGCFQIGLSFWVSSILSYPTIRLGYASPVGPEDLRAMSSNSKESLSTSWKYNYHKYHKKNWGVFNCQMPTYHLLISCRQRGCCIYSGNHSILRYREDNLFPDSLAPRPDGYKNQNQNQQGWKDCGCDWRFWILDLFFWIRFFRVSLDDL